MFVLTCKTCRHWDSRPQPIVVAGQGLCRFDPPRIIPGGMVTEDDRTGVWPITKELDWCSHHEHP
jgi:hypothetical protein